MNFGLVIKVPRKWKKGEIQAGVNWTVDGNERFGIVVKEMMSMSGKV